VHKHFVTKVTDLPLFIEGQFRETNEEKDYAEVRFDGPYAHEESRSFWVLDLEINVLVSSIPDEKDAHRIYKNVGKVAAAFERFIEVFRYGDNPGDDSTLLGCLIIKQSQNQTIFISHFGKIDPKVNLIQATVEAHYKMEITV
jgi:hypothetical protein